MGCSLSNVGNCVTELFYLITQSEDEAHFVSRNCLGKHQ
jgi:hypothetical protein